MLCSNCGQPIDEGKAFCKSCGAPAPAGGDTSAEASTAGASAGADVTATMAGSVTDGATTAGGTGPTVTDLDATAIRPAFDAPPPPAFAVTPVPPPEAGPPLSGTASLGSPPLGSPPPGSSPQPPQGGYGGGWGPPQSPYGPPSGQGGGNRTGLIFGSVLAAVIVLAGLGIGLWLGLRDDGTTTSSSDQAVTGTTGGAMTTDTLPGGTGETFGGAVTTQTLPGTVTSAGPGSTGGTATTEDLLSGWYFTHDELVSELDYEDVRIPELAQKINATVPDVSQWVYDELADMADALDAATNAVAATPVPPGFDDAHYWLLQAAGHMANRIQATMDGIYSMWYTGLVDSATAEFNTGRAERDAYRDAMTEHWAHMPPD